MPHFLKTTYYAILNLQSQSHNIKGKEREKKKRSKHNKMTHSKCNHCLIFHIFNFYIKSMLKKFSAFVQKQFQYIMETFG
jgi:hypothetical protein